MNRCIHAQVGYVCAGQAMLREVHLPDNRMYQQFLGVAPHQLFPYLWRKAGEWFKVLQPALRSDKGIV